MSLPELDAALAWAARGFRVFRLKPNSKFPLRDSQWTLTASSDRAAVVDMWIDPATGDVLDGNIGVLTDGLVVVDVDTKHQGAMEALLDLDIPLDTLTVRTPSGGLHVYYEGANVALSQQKLGVGIDIRSYHGYVLAPGSTINGRAYTLALDEPMQSAPQNLVSRCDAPSARHENADVSLAPWDLDANIEQAKIMLRACPVAIEGSGGDAMTVKVACAVRDYAISEETCIELMLELWNERCSPPWTPEELAKKIGNAYRYAQNPPGSKAASSMMTGIVLPEMPAFRSSISEHLRFRAFPDPTTLPKRPWIMKGLLCRRVVTVLSAQGGSGKSGLTVALAAHIAAGRGYADFELAEPTKVLLMSLEEDMNDLYQRMFAACQVFEIEPAVAAASVAIVPRTDLGWKISLGKSPVVQESEIDAVSAFCRDNGIGAIIFDPFRKTHQSDENDTTSMDVIVDAFTRLAAKANAAVLVCHHVGKRSDKQSIAGDAGAARGASSIIDAARLAFTLVNATEKDVELGVPRTELGNYVRLDMSKANLVKMASAPTWFVKDEVTLPNGETAFAMRPRTVKADRMATAEQLARVMVRILQDNGTMRLKWHEIASQVVDREPLWGNPGKSETNAQRILAAKNAITKHIGFAGFAVRIDGVIHVLKRTSVADAQKGESTHFVEMELKAA